MENYYCVIMAGGVGSRFWPLSRTSKPKQFLDILGVGKTLIQQTFDRFTSICPIENIYIVTNIEYKDIVIEQLPDINPNQILLEPFRKNTAPCIAYASYKIQKINPNAILVVAPSDHLILKIEEFISVIKNGLSFAEKNDALLTLGIKPSRIETGYGYIQINNGELEGLKNLRKVKTFTEKPDYDLAKIFFESGEFYWNSGIFIWSLSSIIEAFENYLSDINILFKSNGKFFDTEKEENIIEKIYTECKTISIDYGVMEKASNVYVLCSDFGWSDLGTWGSLYDYSKKDENKNAVNGENIFLYDTKGCIINIPNEKLVVLQGLNDYVVVEADNMLLICRKEDEQEIKQFVKDVKLAKGDSYI
ncbi:MAG: mannose-1-phosphate guanylyltransferase [Bacteroidales bacterium]|nr:mannose-1-phosphate guanylyltransferase [Bacteroidales bacterium]